MQRWTSKKTLINTALILGILATGLAFFGGSSLSVGGTLGTINRLPQFTSTSSPYSALTPRTHGKDLYMPYSWATTSGSVATTLCLTGDSCITSWPAGGGGGGGTGSVGTSTVPTTGNLSYWTTSGATPELLGEVATTSITAGTGLSFTGTPGALVGGSNVTINAEVQSSDLHDAVTLAGVRDYITLSGQELTRGVVDISDDTNLSGDTEIVLTGDTLSIASSLARDSELHDAITVSGVRDYITLTGQDIVRGVVDISDDTNLAGDTEIVLTGDALSIASTIARDSELHDAVTITGTPDYLTLATQQITLNRLDIADDLNTFTSAQLAGRLTNETGSGLSVFGTSPTLTSPTLSSFFGTPCAGNQFLQDISDTGAFSCATASGGGGDFAWDVASYGVSTSTTLGMSAGLIAASSTFTGDLTVNGGAIIASTTNQANPSHFNHMIFSFGGDNVLTGNSQFDGHILFNASTTYDQTPTGDCLILGIFGGCSLPAALEYRGTTYFRRSPQVLGTGFLFWAAGELRNEPTKTINIGPFYTLADGTRHVADTSNLTQSFSASYLWQPQYYGENGGVMTAGTTQPVAAMRASLSVLEDADVQNAVTIISFDPTIDTASGDGDGRTKGLGKYAHIVLQGGNTASSTSNIVTGQSTIPSGTWDWYSVDQDPSKYSGGKIEDVVTKTSAYTATLNDNIIIATSGTWTLTLPNITSTEIGLTYHLKNRGAGTITVDGNGADTIDGSTTRSLTSNQGIIITAYSTTQWAIISSI